jgi:hypothetical protein
MGNDKPCNGEGVRGWDKNLILKDYALASAKKQNYQNK